MLKIAGHILAFLHGFIAVLFTCAAVALIAMAARVGWVGVLHGQGQQAAQEVIEALGLLAAAVVALQMSQTILEEEIIRASHISAPTRVRRFLSRFFVVVLVALAIEGLVAAFKAIHEDVENLVYASALILATGGLLAGWGVFIRMNRYAEELEPEAMEKAKREDRKLE